MKFSEFMKEDKPESSELALITKVIKALGLTASLKKRTNLMFEDGVRATTAAVRNGVTAGYWNYVTQAAVASKIGGDLRALTWALNGMVKGNASELPFVKELSKEAMAVFVKMDDAADLFKAMDATQLCLSEIAKKAKDSTVPSLERSMARGVLKKLGVAEFFGVKDEA